MVTIYGQPYKGSQNKYRNIMRAQRSKSARESQIPPQQAQTQIPQQPVLNFYQRSRPQSASSHGSRLPNGQLKEYQRPNSTNGIYRTVPQEHQKMQQHIPETNRLAPQALKHTNLRDQIEQIRKKREKENYVYLQSISSIFHTFFLLLKLYQENSNLGMNGKYDSLYNLNIFFIYIYI